ncbi:hypothetical protein E4U09_000770 [Claviceps aff. purpurea]|uniref:Uncharacterized protein n=1 Tax=Claviceps aff. purpurea TaxID=1967640 RepID=A0A9P7TYL3_9HYPO|nr:hypothetical protein E4U09_000770 [Claviceps aff. purpurea]
MARFAVLIKEFKLKYPRYAVQQQAIQSLVKMIQTTVSPHLQLTLGWQNMTEPSIDCLYGRTTSFDKMSTKQETTVFLQAGKDWIYYTIFNPKLLRTTQNPY